MSEHRNWWGQYELKTGELARWQIGPMELMVQHQQNEWRVNTKAGTDPLVQTLAIDAPWQPETSPDTASWDRFGLRQDTQQLFLKPLLADRSIVTRPEMTFYLVGGETATLYLTTQLWLQIGVQLQNERVFREVPLYRPSDTWFGHSRMEGELCYASRTEAHVTIDQVIHRPHRAVTCVELKHRGLQTIEFVRINLPMANLSLFSNEQGQLWTNSVSMEFHDGQSDTRLSLEPAPPSIAGSCSLLASPRTPAAESTVVRTFRSLFMWES